MRDHNKPPLDRRKFLKSVMAGTLLGSLGSLAGGAISTILARSLPRRVLGKTGLRVTILGMPGYHIGRIRDDAVAIRMLERAFDLGVNFYDSAWAYVGGRSEARLGKALRNKRHKVFLMSKVIARDKKGARQQIEQSLQRLQTDYLDLWQFHSLTTPADIEKIWGPSGAMETAIQARREGKVRHIGFTGHRDPQVHLQAILQYHDTVETVQMPLNPADPHYASFETIVLPKAIEYNLGVIAMKTVANGALVEDRIVSAAECHRYAWSLPVSTLVAGMDTPEQLEENFRQALDFQALAEDEKEALLTRTKPHAGADFEVYKTDRPFPEWRMFPREPIR